MDAEIQKLIYLLSKNADKPFVQRIINKNQYPVLQNPDKSVSTHSMAWSEQNGKYYVYPTVVMSGKELKRLEDQEAWDQSQKTGNFIEFNTPEEADWFSKNYKKIWK